MGIKFRIVVLMVLAASASPAVAQLGPGLTQPPVFESVDQNGVEVQTGKIVRTVASISIGPGGPGSLRFDWTSQPGRESVGGSIKIVQNPQVPSKDIATVSVNGSSETFSAPHGTTNFTQDQGRPSTLVYNSGNSTYAYTTPDGTIGIFSFAGNAGILTSLTYPAGQVLNFYYGQSVTAVTSNLGYQLRLIRSSGNIVGAVAFNMNSET